MSSNYTLVLHTARCTLHSFSGSGPNGALAPVLLQKDDVDCIQAARSVSAHHKQNTVCIVLVDSHNTPNAIDISVTHNPPPPPPWGGKQFY